MKLHQFPECNAVIGAGQAEYEPLPAFIDPRDPTGRAVFCWKLSLRERLKLLLTGELWHEVLTFRKPFQPQMISTLKPTERLTCETDQAPSDPPAASA